MTEGNECLYFVVKVKLGVGTRLILKYEYFKDCDNVSTLQVHVLMSAIRQLESSYEYVIDADVHVEELVEKIEHVHI